MNSVWSIPKKSMTFCSKLPGLLWMNLVGIKNILALKLAEWSLIYSSHSYSIKVWSSLMPYKANFTKTSGWFMQSHLLVEPMASFDISPDILTISPFLTIELFPIPKIMSLSVIPITVTLIKRKSWRFPLGNLFYGSQLPRRSRKPGNDVGRNSFTPIIFVTQEHRQRPVSGFQLVVHHVSGW